MMAAETTTKKRRAVVTGMGVITSLGEDTDTLWQNLTAGRSGISTFHGRIPEHEITCPIGGVCAEFEPEKYMDKREARRMDRFTQFGVAASKLALDDAGIVSGENVEPTRLAAIVSSAAGGIGTIEQQLKNALDKGFAKTSPFLVPMMIADMAAGRVSIHFGAKGPNLCIVTACATGADSIGEALRLIENNEADVVIAGGAEAPITSLSVAGFAACRALSARYDEPTKASRPFDKDRDGFVMAEGAAVVILESLEHAQKRGAKKIYGELMGYGRSSDANDVVAPCADGDGARRAMENALKDAAVSADSIGYINAHGTSTPLGDIAETIAVKRIFGERAANKQLPVSSTKSMTGHLLGSAGSIEAVISLLAIQKQVLPPTINLDNHDPECDLDYVPNEARKVEGLKRVMSNSFGFGGHNASLIFGEPPTL